MFFFVPWGAFVVFFKPWVVLFLTLPKDLAAKNLCKVIGYGSPPSGAASLAPIQAARLEPKQLKVSKLLGKIR